MATNLGNTKLVKHGIYQENVDLRIHVAVKTRRVYIFETHKGIKAIETGKYPSRPVYTGNIVTAIGYIVPPDDIEGCRCVPIPDNVLEGIQFDIKDSTPKKGEKAERLANRMILMGLIPLTISIASSADQELQINGSDFEILQARSIQVKCDWSAGPREYGGTGNLFLQIQECNPLGLH